MGGQHVAEMRDWEKVPFDEICQRIRKVQALEALDEEVVTALAVATCLCFCYPRKLSNLVTRAKTAIGALVKWLREHGEDAPYANAAKEFLDKTESLRRILYKPVTTPDDLPHQLTIVFDVDGKPTWEARNKEDAPRPPNGQRTSLVRFYRADGAKVSSDLFLVIGVGILREWIVAHPHEMEHFLVPRTCKDPILRRACDLVGGLLDGLEVGDARLDGGLPHITPYLVKQYRRAVRGLKTPPPFTTKLLVEQRRLSEPVAFFAWLPMRGREEERGGRRGQEQEHF